MDMDREDLILRSSELVDGTPEVLEIRVHLLHLHRLDIR